MLSSPRNSVTHNQQAKLAIDYNELLKELSSPEITSVGCYTIGETIGQGTYGKVKKGTHKLTGKVVAIKKISKQHAPMMAREIHHHRQLKHPNIVMLYEMITTESAIHIISEYCSNGDLLDALTNEPTGRCSEARVRKWCLQLTDAIKYCHTRGIVHRDLKLENILLDSNDNTKICDFGFARFAQKNQLLETFCGSLSYSAPEVILAKKYTGPECDVWSLGVILFTLLAGEYPFDDDSEVATQRKIVAVDYKMPFYFSADLDDLISNMLQQEPSNRLTVDAILKHPWTAASTISTEDNDGEQQEETENHSDESSIEEEDTCLTPSSSTTTSHPFLSVDMSNFLSENNCSADTLISGDINNKTKANDAVSSDPLIKFSPHVRSSLGMTLRPSKQQQQQQQQKSPRFSAPTALSASYSSSVLQPSSPLQNDIYQQQSTPYRTSLPSSFFNASSKFLHYDNIHLQQQNALPSMTPAEQRLFAALTAAGFDKDALIKMQSGHCDTSSTLWHILLESMSINPSVATDRKAQSVPDAFVSALESRNKKMMLSMSALNSPRLPFSTETANDSALKVNGKNSSHNEIEGSKIGVDRGIQTESIDDSSAIKESLRTMHTEIPSTKTASHNSEKSIRKLQLASTTSYIQPYPRPSLSSQQQRIETVGFGSPILQKNPYSTSTTAPAAYGKPTWLSSVKSWFGSSTPLSNNDTTAQPPLQQRHRSPSNCSTISSPIATPSSYRNFDTTVQTNDASMIISSPIYRNGGSLSSQQQQKSRRRALQLSTPPTSELDKLPFTNIGTCTSSKTTKRFSQRLSSATTTSRTSSSNINNSTTLTSTTYQHYLSNIKSVDNMLTMPRPTTALVPPSTRDVHFSILTETAELKEIDMLTEKRYPSSSFLCKQSTSSCMDREHLYDSSSSSSESDDSNSSVESSDSHRDGSDTLSLQEPSPSSIAVLRATNTLSSSQSDTDLKANHTEEEHQQIEHTATGTAVECSFTDPSRDEQKADHTTVPLTNPSLSCTAETPAPDEHTVQKIVDEPIQSLPASNHSRLTEVLEMKKKTAPSSSRRPIKPLTLSEKTSIPAGHPSPSLSSPTTSVYSPRSSRFEFAPRSRLSVYGMQESRSTPMASKVIVEEEEEEEEE